MGWECSKDREGEGVHTGFNELSGHREGQGGDGTVTLRCMFGK